MDMNPLLMDCFAELNTLISSYFVFKCCFLCYLFFSKWTDSERSVGLRNNEINKLKY